MRHAALIALLAAFALPAGAAGTGADSAVAGTGDAAFLESLRGIRDLVRPRTGEPRFVPVDFVKPRQRPGLEGLDREQANLFAETAPATFIVRVGAGGDAAAGTGSGFFIHPDGTGMTNVHVVGARIGTEVDIETARGPKKARILAVAPGRDIAIIKVSNDTFADWTALTMGAALNAGHSVFAIGNPLDMGATFTRGMVSRPGQDKMSAWMDVLQLDIMINPGNSGGALVDSSGRLVGMNQAIARSEVADGVGFAIPVQELARARAEFAATGRLRDSHTSLGVVGDDLAVVRAEGAPAAAGFRFGDAIMSFPGSDSAALGRRVSALHRAAARSQPGQTIAVSVVHGVPARIHTAAGAGGAAVASADVVFNPATGVLVSAASRDLAVYLMSVTQISVEELEYNGARYVIEPMGAPGPQGMVFNAVGFARKALTPVVLNLPVEEYTTPL